MMTVLEFHVKHPPYRRYIKLVPSEDLKGAFGVSEKSDVKYGFMEL